MKQKQEKKSVRPVIFVVLAIIFALLSAFGAPVGFPHSIGFLATVMAAIALADFGIEMGPFPLMAAVIHIVFTLGCLLSREEQLFGFIGLGITSITLIFGLTYIAYKTQKPQNPN